MIDAATEVPYRDTRTRAIVRAGGGNGAWLRLLALTAFVFEWLGFAALVVGMVNAGLFMAFHLCICLLACVIWRSRASPKDIKEHTVPAATFVAALLLGGPFGATIAAVFLLPQARQMTVTTSDAPGLILARHVPCRVEHLCKELLDQRLRIAGTWRTRPLIDVVTEGTLGEKFEALSLISKKYDPAMAPALQRALVDADAPVRVLAAAVMSKVLGQLQTGVTSALAQADLAKADLGNADQAPTIALHWQRVADARLQLSTSGLLDAGALLAEWQQLQIDLLRARDIEAQHDASEARHAS
jgi:hypothetical protein